LAVKGGDMFLSSRDASSFCSTPFLLVVVGCLFVKPSLQQASLRRGLVGRRELTHWMCERDHDDQAMSIPNFRSTRHWRQTDVRLPRGLRDFNLQQSAPIDHSHGFIKKTDRKTVLLLPPRS
jgi:hypothetical protein